MAREIFGSEKILAAGVTRPAAVKDIFRSHRGVSDFVLDGCRRCRTRARHPSRAEESSIVAAKSPFSGCWFFRLRIDLVRPNLLLPGQRRFFPLFLLEQLFHRLWRAFRADWEGSFKFELVFSESSFSDLMGKFEPQKYPSLFRSSVSVFQTEFEAGYFIFLVSPIIQSFA